MQKGCTMVATRIPRIPSYCRHATGQGFCRIAGRDIYFGTHGTPDSLARYDRTIAEWMAKGRTLAPNPMRVGGGTSVADLIDAFRQHADAYYVRTDGTPTPEVEAFRHALRPLRELYGTLPAIEYSPLKLEATRNAMIAKGWSRKTINRHIGRVKQLFGWATTRELVPGTVAYALRELKGLKRGRGGKERPKVKPVPDAAVDAVLPFVSAQVAAMIQLQGLTGARPSEVCAIRGCDIDTSKAPWVYTPAEHKTEHHDIERFIYLGPQAQDVIKPFLKTDLQAHLFSPTEAEAARNAQRRADRKTPMTPSQLARKAKAKPKRAKGERYSVAAYRRCIARACDIAFPPPDALAKLDDETSAQWKARLTVEQRKELRQWRKLHRWHPHQLRHTAGTRFRREYGAEASQVLLGHASLHTTEIYAEKDQARAMQIMAKIG
jgi:integrase